MESQISASSVHFGVLGLQRWGPELARLNNQGIVNAWTSASNDRNPWIEVKGEACQVLNQEQSDGADLTFELLRSTCSRRCA